MQRKGIRIITIFWSDYHATVYYLILSKGETISVISLCSETIKTALLFVSYWVAMVNAFKNLT